MLVGWKHHRNSRSICKAVGKTDVDTGTCIGLIFFLLYNLPFSIPFSSSVLSLYLYLYLACPFFFFLFSCCLCAPPCTLHFVVTTAETKCHLPHLIFLLSFPLLFLFNVEYNVRSGSWKRGILDPLDLALYAVVVIFFFILLMRRSCLQCAASRG